LLDVRPLHVNNWSHALNQALPLALHVQDIARANGCRNATVVLPEGAIPNFVLLLDVMGIAHIRTNSRVQGNFVICGPNPSGMSQYLGRQWLTPHLKILREFVSASLQTLPRKFFLDRRVGRHLLNGEEVRSFLRKNGYMTVYSEDLSPAEQLALFIGAEDIVAIHGAGLAPLMYRMPGDGPFRLVEVLSPGLMSGFFLSLTEGLPVDYRVVRGTPTREMAGDAYAIAAAGKSYKQKYDMAPFAVDLSALELAIREERIDEMLANGVPLDGVETT
jgi:hypothetical protein